MKTKHILTALALPMAFAACTDEQFEGMDNNLMTKENRPVVGQVSFMDTDIESRLTVGAATGALTWEKGDAFGMVLMDQESTGVGTANIGTRKYDLVNKAYSNYPFTNDGSNTWKSEAQLLEGNYFYYFPYVNNQKNEAGERSVSRNGGLRWAIEGSQKAYTEANGVKTLNTYNAVKDNQLYVGYQDLNADDGKTSLDNKMVQVYPTVYFKLTNTDANPVVINRVVLENAAVNDGTSITADFFNLYSQLDVEDGKSNTYSFTSFDKDGDGDVDAHIVAASANIATAFKAYNEAVSTDRLYHWGKTPWANMATSYWTVSGAQSTIALNFPTTTLAKNQSVAGVMVVPNSLTTTSLQARIYTNKGLVLVPLKVGGYNVTTVAEGVTKGLVSYASHTSEETAAEAVVSLMQYKGDALAYDNALAKDATFAKLVPNQGATVTISFNADAIAVPGKMDIYSTDDLDAFLSYCVAANVQTETNLEATLKADDVELSKYAYNVLKGNDNIKLTVLADEKDRKLTISSEITGTDALKVLTWDADGKVVNAAIEEGATQTVSANFANKIFNKGTLKVEQYTGTPAVVTATTIGNIYNAGNLTVVTPLIGSVINGSLEDDYLKRTYDNTVSTANAAINANVVGTVLNFGVLTSTASDIDNIRNMKMTKVDNTDKIGQITVNADLTANIQENGGTITIGQSVEFIAADTSVSAGTITNNGYFKPEGTFENSGTFNNNYGVNVVSKTAEFNNTGSLIIADAAVYTYITSNETGSITIYDRQEELRVATDAEYGKVIYTAVEGDYVNGQFLTMNGDKFNDLIIEKAGADLTNVNRTKDANNNTISAETVTALSLNVNSNCSYKFNNNASFANLTVGKVGNTTPCIIQIDAVGLNITKGWTIYPKTTMHITTGKSVSYTGTAAITNNGVVLVGGTLTINLASNPGKFEEAGGNILWN